MDEKDREFHLRMNALKLAIEHHNMYGEDEESSAVLETAKKYYEFLKGE